MSILRGLFESWIGMMWWLIAVIAAAAPRRLWDSLDPRLPLRRAAAVSGVATLSVGFVIGIDGFFRFAATLADANNTWVLRQLAGPPSSGDSAVGLVPYGVSVLTLFIFLFFTPTGLFSLYVVVSGTIRAIAGWLDEPEGDLLLTAVYAATSRLAGSHRATRAQRTRERLEGANEPDRLVTGDSVDVAADYVVVASRRKAEWLAGAIVMTSEEWYRLGAPKDVRTDRGLRTFYPLTRLESPEVVRRGIQYELPRLTRRPITQLTTVRRDA